MKVSKEKFLKAIDADDHLNAKTKDAYWHHVIEKYDKDIKKLYEDINTFFPKETGLHHYIRYSLDQFFKNNPIHQLEGRKADDASDDEKKIQVSWGYNDDVKLK